jgi:CBS domain-containing protein
MLAYQLIHTTLPSINLSDKVSFALQLMEDYDVLHLPVAGEDKFIGMVSKEELLDADENASIATIENRLVKAAIKREEFFLHALKIASHNELSVIAVVNEQQELTGTITMQDLILQLSKFVGNDEPGGVIVYSFGEISRLVETNDAYITQLNSSIDAETGIATVTIKINKTEISDIIATFQRYDYIVKYYFGEEQFANELKENYSHLMSYLGM